jgi:hypothetical protein
MLRHHWHQRPDEDALIVGCRWRAAPGVGTGGAELRTASRLGSPFGEAGALLSWGCRIESNHVSNGLRAPISECAGRKNNFTRGQTSLRFRHRWRLGLAQQARRMMGRQRPQVARRPLLSAAVASVLSVATSK